jgi:hypothetical protein
VALHPPHVRRFVPPSEEEAARLRAGFERRRAEMDAARVAGRPARRAAVLAGPALRDADAAVDCLCGCHPRPAEVDLHDGGRSCPCQLTDAERAEQRRAWLASWGELAANVDDDEQSESEQAAAFADAAAALGVEARIRAWAAPFVIVGLCDGRGFYLRERHGSYRVVIAPDDDPGSDPWAAAPTDPSIDVAAGDENELADHGAFSPATALRVAVEAVRSALARNACVHRRVDAEPYCPSCGVRIDEADAWRWSTVADPDTDGA